MTAVEHTTVLPEAAAIQSLREALQAAEKRLEREAHATGREYNYGRVCEAIYTAEQALFQVLNIGANYLDCRECAVAIEDGSRRVREATS